MNVMQPPDMAGDFDTRTLLKNAERQAAQRGYDDFMIVDSDSHHHEPDVWKEVFSYMDDPVLRRLAEYGNGEFTMRTTGGYSEMSGRIPRQKLRKRETFPPKPHREIV